MRTTLSWPAVASSLPQWENFIVQTAPWGNDTDAVTFLLFLFTRRTKKLRSSYHVLSAQVLHDLNLIEVEGTLETVCCLELGRPGVRHTLVITGWWIILVCVEHWAHPKQKVREWEKIYATAPRQKEFVGNERMFSKQLNSSLHIHTTTWLFTFITHTLHFIDCLLSILLSQMLGSLHRQAQEFLKLSADQKWRIKKKKWN